MSSSRSRSESPEALSNNIMHRVELQRPIGLIELRSEIERVSKRIDKLLKDRDVLSGLFNEFVKLAFDKLSLDASFLQLSQSNCDLTALRVIQGRTQAVAQFYSPGTIPLLSERGKSRDQSLPTNQSGGKLGWSSKLSICFSKRAAEAYLNDLTQKLHTLSQSYTGLTDTIKRFREDNAALRDEVMNVRSKAISISDPFEHTCKSTASSGCASSGHASSSKFRRSDIWVRLADVDLFTPNSTEQQTIVASQRRQSALATRRKTFTSCYTGPSRRSSMIHPDSDTWSVKSYTSRRRSGAVNTSDYASFMQGISTQSISRKGPPVFFSERELASHIEYPTEALGMSLQS